MKKLKQWISSILFLAIALCLAMPVLAQDMEYTLKITSKTPNHDYEAYQVFKGTLAEDPNAPGSSTLVNLEWGSGVTNTADLLNEIKQISVLGEDAAPEIPFAACTDVESVADVLVKENKAAVTDAFAEVVAKYLTASPTGKATTDNGVDVEGKKVYTATIENLPAGYYLVKEATFSGTEGNNNAYTKYILNIVKTDTIEAKAEVPTLDKAVQAKGDSAPVDATEVSIGDAVTYTLTSKVPAMDGYNKYFFIVSDTLSKGLTLQEDTVAVKINDSMLTRGEDYTVTTDPNPVVEGNPTTLKIVFKDFIQYKEQAGNPIQITYNATLNKYAEIGSAGNPNKASLVYSNDPNFDYKGGTDPDQPDYDHGEPTGITPDAITNVYTVKIQINKVNEDGYPLTGAEFAITGEGVVTTGVTASDVFNKDVDGTYYKLKSGAYTTTPPVISGGEDDTSDLYYDTTTKYKRTEGTTDWITKAEATDVKGEVGADGVVSFAGLGAGTYTITETKTPANYNTIEPITLKISFTPPEDGVVTGEEKGTWSATYKVGENGQEQELTADDNGLITMSIENRSGAELPSTGGIGTTIFLFGGAGLMAAVLVVLALRVRGKKKESDEI